MRTPSETLRAKRVDRRACSRYSLQIVARCRIAGTSLARGWKQVRTLDMSAGGILLELSDEVEAGTRMELIMDWTGLYHGRDKMRLYVFAVVTRVDERGIAVRILRHQFREFQPAAVRPSRGERKLAVA